MEAAAGRIKVFSRTSFSSAETRPGGNRALNCSTASWFGVYARPARGEAKPVQECNEIYNEDAIPADAFTTGKRAVL